MLLHRLMGKGLGELYFFDASERERERERERN